MNFLPENYKSPTTSNGYMKIQDGENKVRILSSPIIGWEDWINNKPVRYRNDKKPDKSADPLKPIRHFWAFIVWDYTESKICILELTQASVRKKIEALSKDRDWGSPFNYDLKIIRSGSKKDTEYEVNPISPKEVTQSIKDAFAATSIDLEELFSGADPFVNTGHRTKAFWEIASPSVREAIENFISQDQVNWLELQIHQFISAADPKFRDRALAALKIPSFKELPSKLLDSVIRRIEEKKNIIIEEVPF